MPEKKCYSEMAENLSRYYVPSWTIGYRDLVVLTRQIHILILLYKKDYDCYFVGQIWILETCKGKDIKDKRVRVKVINVQTLVYLP